MDRAYHNPFVTPHTPFAAAWESLPTVIRNPLNYLVRMTYIVSVEAMTVLMHAIPAKLTWLWRLHVERNIQSMVVLGTVDKVTKAAYLYQQSPLKVTTGEKIRPVLTCHGDYGDPSNLLPQANLAQKAGLPTFSLYMPIIHVEAEHDHNVALLEAAIEKIKSLIQSKGGIFDGVLMIGHSSGGILAAKLQFVDSSDPSTVPSIRATCAIGSRLNSIIDDDCKEVIIRKIVREVHSKIQQKPDLPLVQIVGQEDWNAPQEVMMVRRGPDCHSVPGMHLSCLYQPETMEYVAKFLVDYQAGRAAS